MSGHDIRGRRHGRWFYPTVACVLLGIAHSHDLLSFQLPWLVTKTIFLFGNWLVRALLWFVALLILSIVLVSGILWFLLKYSSARSDQYKSRRQHNLPQLDLSLAFPKVPGNYFQRIYADRVQPFTFPESEAIENLVQEIINLVIQRHVQSWYHHISNRPLFSTVVEYLLRTALINVKRRLETVDVVGIIVRKAVPIITQHLHELSIAEAKVMETVKPVGLDSLKHSSICDAVATHCKGHVLHLAAQTSDFDEEHVVEPEDKLQTYLRSIVARLLPSLLPDNEYASSIVTVFIREILACAILAPIFRMLADPDFWNETLVVRANQAVQERARVKRFRHVLKEQTREQSGGRKHIKKKPMRKLERLMLSNDPKDWERLYRKIKKSQSLVDITRMRNEMMLLRQEALAAAHIDNGVNNTSKSDHLIIKTLSLLEARIITLGGSHSPDLLKSPLQSLSFDRTLATGVNYFLDFLQRHGRVQLLDFWHRVAQIKLRVTQPIPKSQLSILESPVQLSKTQIQDIYETYLHSPLLSITDEEKQLVHNYLINEPDTYDVDSNEIIVLVARRAYKTMESDDYPAFRNDKLFYTMLSNLETEAAARKPLERSSSSVSMTRYSRLGLSKFRSLSSTDLVDLGQEYLGQETIGSVDNSERDVLTAMEDALHSSVLTESGNQSSESTSMHTAQHDDELDSDFSLPDGDDSAMEGVSIARPGVPHTVQSPITDLKMAEPGNLNLVEEIDVLDQEIRKRQYSLNYIDKFLKNKSSIDEGDRKIVNKSRIQTMRELDTLLSQKREYEADDHALYGRSTVVIESSMTQQDPDGNDYTVYVVEVRRIGADGTQSGWIITRRYSEFNELHSQLKHRFPHVAHLNFPKKQLNRLKSIADVRRPILESFLQNLLKDEQVCQSQDFRYFLSQNNLTVKKRPHKTVLENLIGLTDPREAFSRLFAMLEGPDEARVENPDLRQVHPAPGDHDEDLSLFAKPIVDLILEAFDLRERNKWIRKRAVVLVLQQILGGTIESRVRDAVGTLLKDSSLLTLLHSLHARLATSSDEPVRATKTRAERIRLSELAQETLRAHHPPYVPDGAAKKMFRALQIRTLNLHLLGKLTDAVFDAIFIA